MREKRSICAYAASGAEWTAVIKEHLEGVEELLIECVNSAGEGLRDIISHVLGAGGKRLRPALTILSALVSGDVSESTTTYAAAIELIHTASLLHDDVIDGARVRRGRPSANVLWGDSAAIVAGDFLLSRAFGLFSKHPNEHVLSDIAETAQKMCCGQMLELAHAFDFDMGSKQYFEIIKLKTAELFASACYVGSISAGADRKDAACFRRFGLFVGMAFQIVDDLLDLIGSEERLGKPVGQDLKSGKVTLPLIELLRELEGEGNDDMLIKIRESMKIRCIRDEIIAELRDLIISRRIDERMKVYASEFANRATASLRQLNLERREVLLQFARFIAGEMI